MSQKREFAMKTCIKPILIFTIVIFNMNARNANMTLDRMHQRLDQALETAQRIPVTSLLKRGGTGNTLQGQLELDIREVNGVKLITGLKRKNNILDKLFWCKQTELVQQFQYDSDLGRVALAGLIKKRCVSNVNPLIIFIHELVAEDDALDCCQQNAVGQEIEQVKAYQAVLDALLECIAKALGVGN